MIAKDPGKNFKKSHSGELFLAKFLAVTLFEDKPCPCEL